MAGLPPATSRDPCPCWRGWTPWWRPPSLGQANLQGRRYFVRDGQVQCHHPYWPEDALRFEGRRPWGWRKRLKVLNQETFGEVSRLWVYAERLAAHLDGYWSVDF